MNSRLNIPIGINKIKKKGLFQKELNRSKMYLKGRMSLSFENPQFLANWIGLNYLFEGKVLYPDFLLRKIEHFFDKNKFLGTDKLIKKKKSKNTNFEIRFHFEPGVKITKTQDTVVPFRRDSDRPGGEDDHSPSSPR